MASEWEEPETTKPVAADLTGSLERALKTEKTLSVHCTLSELLASKSFEFYLKDGTLMVEYKPTNGNEPIKWNIPLGVGLINFHAMLGFLSRMVHDSHYFFVRPKAFTGHYHLTVMDTGLEEAWEDIPLDSADEKDSVANFQEFMAALTTTTPRFVLVLNSTMETAKSQAEMMVAGLKAMLGLGSVSGSTEKLAKYSIHYEDGTTEGMYTAVYGPELSMSRADIFSIAEEIAEVYAAHIEVEFKVRSQDVKNRTGVSTLMPSDPMSVPVAVLSLIEYITGKVNHSHSSSLHRELLLISGQVLDTIGRKKSAGKVIFNLLCENKDKGMGVVEFLDEIKTRMTAVIPCTEEQVKAIIHSRLNMVTFNKGDVCWSASTKQMFYKTCNGDPTAEPTIEPVAAAPGRENIVLEQTQKNRLGTWRVTAKKQ